MNLENEELVQRSKELKNSLIAWRRHFHKYPELSFRERRTSDFILNILNSLGVFEIERNIGGYGIVATIRASKGPVIGIRADMDALPIQEETEEDYQSVHPYVMHACGHDAHMAILLGVAHLIAEDAKAGRLKGTIKLIFQPAEENGDETGLTGAPYLLQSGAIDDVEQIIALHVCPWRKTGELQINRGPSMANIDNFSLTIKGEGGHGGYPQQTKDPVWITSFILQGIYSLISRKVNPMEVGTISIGHIHGGSAFNVIPEEVKISGTIRSYRPHIRKQLINELRGVAEIANTLGGEYDLEIEYGEPALFNDHWITNVLVDSAYKLYPKMNIHEGPFGMGGEDLGHITEKIPGAMFFLGCGKNSKNDAVLHTPTFNLDEEALPIGVSLLMECAHQLMQRKEN
ncbi:M20 family metallopeptidase [Evansella sp. AB-P1]|uniref:M20 metallopeptidase family protein n=1 Tax=Evansella sp. AB-P1 TaxID=3037653 RepID=UPI00241E7BD8|nr:M20 family metallopeptidase [Evansella sp. AB-P1]MDG5787847.1 M20 family metallopeptidase [Evansella sp. AB-P1]